MTGPCAPWPIAELDIADAGQQKTSPLAAVRQLAAALASELKGQRGFLAAFLVPQDERAELAPMAAIEADDLFALPDGLRK